MSLIQIKYVEVDIPIHSTNPRMIQQRLLLGLILQEQSFSGTVCCQRLPPYLTKFYKLKHKASRNFPSQIFLKENTLYAVKKGKNLLLNPLAMSEPCYPVCTPPLGLSSRDCTNASPSRSACLPLGSSQDNHNEILKKKI